MLIDHELLLHNTNQMLSLIGINRHGKKIMSIEELQRVASSMFVAIYESLFQERIDGIIRNPQAIEDYEENAQMIVDRVGDRIHMGLQHITGAAITEGDLMAILNLINIFTRIANITSRKEIDSVQPPKNPQQTLSSPKSSNNSHMSISEAGIIGGIGSGLNLMMSFQNVAQIIRSNERKIEQIGKLEAAKHRRESTLRMKETLYRSTNEMKSKRASIAREQRISEDYVRNNKAINARVANQEYILLRKVSYL